MTAGSLRTLSYLHLGTFPRLAGLGRTAQDDPAELLVAIYRAMYAQGYPTATARTFLLPSLSTVQVPTLVIAGGDDPLVRVAAGRDIARQIPGAVLRTYPGMGHALPEELWPEIVGHVRDLAARA